MVAHAIASPTFTGTATVADLWVSIPTFPTPRSLVGERPRCLFVEAAYASESGQSVMESVLAPTHAILRKPPAEAAGLLAPFPSARGFEIAGERSSVIEGRDSEAIVAFPAEGGGFRLLQDVADRIREDNASPLGREFVFRPPIGEGAGVPSQLMTLWALLFALSELTRYYPAAWVGALDADDSEVAVTLDHGLELALELVPELLNSGLSGPVARWIEEFRREHVPRAGGDVPLAEEPPQNAD